MHPFVLRNFLSENDWPPLRLWTDDYLTEKLGKGQCLSVRIGEKRHFRGKVLHEHQCDRHTFENSASMLKWMKSANFGPVNGNDETSSAYPNPNTHWAYLDYRDVLDLFEQEEAQYVDWSLLGMKNATEEGENWRNSTVWIGTPGAYTPCHFDTYGFNLHAQLRGYKCWLMFPPDDDSRSKCNLWPTRLPYEESSVFSELDFIGDDPRIDRNMPVWPVMVGPGDLLFVPPKWWHSVQCVNANSSPNDKGDSSCSSSPCISVNKWFPAPGDSRESAKEALLKFMMELFTSSGLLGPDEYICPTERNSMDTDFDALAELVKKRLESAKAESRLDKQSDPKRIKLSPTTKNSPFVEDDPLSIFYKKYLTHSKMERIEPIEWRQWRKKCKSDGENSVIESSTNGEEKRITTEKGLKIELLEALSSSEVLDTLLNVMMSKERITKKFLVIA